jgi:hypothetical protein
MTITWARDTLVKFGIAWEDHLGQQAQKETGCHVLDD